MPTDLRVLAGPSPHSLTDISDKVNTDQGYRIVSDAFEGFLSLQIKRFPAHHRTTSDYFERPERQGITWSIQVQGLFSSSLLSFKLQHPGQPGADLSHRHHRSGRFLQSHSADDVLFGNIFERPLTLPWGSSAAFQFMKCVWRRSRVCGLNPDAYDLCTAPARLVPQVY